MKNKKGISGIVATVIMIALVMAAAAIIWAVINSMMKEKTAGAESCFGNFEKVTLNPMYTCFTDIGNNEPPPNGDIDWINFSINIADVEVDSVLIAISAGGAVKSFEISNTEQTISDLAKYGSTGFGTDNIVLPGENAGMSYVTNFSSSEPDLIEIAPIIGGTQCGVSDSISDIDDCSILG